MSSTDLLPLDGLRVLDLSGSSAGLRAAGIMADYGADTLWVERKLHTESSADVEKAVYNRAKRTVPDDDEQGRGVLADFARTADVVIYDNFSEVGNSASLIDIDLPIAAVRVEISGFRTSVEHVPMYEPLVHAMVGTMAEQKGHRAGPIFEAMPFATLGASYLAVIGGLAALYRRLDDGYGRIVRTSLLDGALAYLSMAWGDSGQDATDLKLTAVALNSAGSRSRLVTGSFRCSDDEYIGVHTGALGAFGRLMVLLGLDGAIPPSEDGIDIGRPLAPEQQAILHSTIHEVFAQHPRSYWVQRLRELDICGIPQLHPTDCFDEPQVQANRCLLIVDDPVLGPMEQVAPTLRFGMVDGHLESHSSASSPKEVGWKRSPTASAVTTPLLSGVKVVDFGAYFAGPYASRLLADLGAEVTKVEPIGGDPLRGLERHFRAGQAGKRSLAANLKDPELRPAVNYLLGEADIVHHNLRPGVAERLGFGLQDAVRCRPDVIYGYAPGWGLEGPLADAQSFEPMMSGYVGLGYEVAGRWNPPLYPVGHADPGNGLIGAVGMLVGLLARRVRGKGIYFEHAQLNATLEHISHVVRLADGDVLNAERVDPLQYGTSAFERLYRCSDGWVCVTCRSDDERRSLIALASEASPRALPSRDGDEFDEFLSMRIETILEMLSTADALLRLNAKNVPAVEPAQYNNIEFMRDPANVQSRRVAVALNDAGRTIREIDQLMICSDADASLHRLAPKLGEHTVEILIESGYDGDQVSRLAERGAIKGVGTDSCGRDFAVGGKSG